MGGENDYMLKTVKGLRENREGLAEFVAVVAKNYPKQYHCLSCNKSQREDTFLECEACGLLGFCSGCVAKGHGDVCQTLGRAIAAADRLQRKNNGMNAQKYRAAANAVMEVALRSDGEELQAFSSADFAKIFGGEDRSRAEDLRVLAERAMILGRPAAAKNFYTEAVHELSRYGEVVTADMARFLFGIGTVVFKTGSQFKHVYALFSMAEAIEHVLKMEGCVPGLEDLGCALKVARIAVFLEERDRSPSAAMIKGQKERLAKLERKRERESEERRPAMEAPPRNAPQEASIAADREIEPERETSLEEEMTTKAEVPEDTKKELASGPKACGACLPCRKKRKCKVIKAAAAKQKARRRAAAAKRITPSAAVRPVASRPPVGRAGFVPWEQTLSDLKKAVLDGAEMDSQKAKKERVSEMDAANVVDTEAIEESVAAVTQGTAAVEAQPMCEESPVKEAPTFHEIHSAVKCGREHGTPLRSSSEAILA